MWRVFGIPTPLSGALHAVALQHTSTLHSASGRHILCCIPAQVKHLLHARSFRVANCALFFGSRARSACVQFVGSACVHFTVATRRTMCHGIHVALTRR
jgi:hypothetical protein